jgi:HAMP domain-containing protein
MAGGTNTAEVRELSALLELGTHRLRAGISRARVDFEVGWLTRRLARTTAIIALLGMLAAWWLSRIFARPIEELAEITRAVKSGSYESKAPVRARDEVGELAAAFTT